MASTIVIKNGTAAPTTVDIIEAEFGLDLTNKKLYSRESDTIIQVGEQDGTAEGTLKRWNNSTKAWDEITTFTVGAAGDITISGTADVNITTTGNVVMSALPTSDPVVAGALWNDSGDLKVSAG